VTEEVNYHVRCSTCKVEQTTLHKLESSRKQLFLLLINKNVRCEEPTGQLFEAPSMHPTRK